jgi:hypothetical protein
MNRLILISGFAFILTAPVLAQVGMKDSVQSKENIIGKEEIKLRPEVLRAIKNGTLINFGPSTSTMKIATPGMKTFISKDFSEYIHADSTMRGLALNELPTGVSKQYSNKELGADPVKEVPGFKIDKPEGPARTTLEGAAVARVDVGELTSRKAYVHNKNAKRDDTWKNYNNLPTPEVNRKRQLAESQINTKLLKDSLAINKDSLAFSIDSVKTRFFGPVLPPMF